jgi:hypothetical protein
MVHHKSRDNPAAVVCDSPRVILLDECLIRARHGHRCNGRSLAVEKLSTESTI